MTITTYQPAYLAEAAGLFVQSFRRLRAAVPTLPNRFEQPEEVSRFLERLFSQCPGVFAFDHGRLAGYLGWYEADDFRGANRRAAFVPVWAQAASPEGGRRVDQALYTAAARQWLASGCEVHCLTLLADQAERLQIWFWQGFGLAVVDAVRPVQPLNRAVPSGITIRRASLADAPHLAEIEAEHAVHYAQPPVLMAPIPANTPEEFETLLSQPSNTVWLALDGEHTAGYLRLEMESFGAAAIVAAPDTIAITGVYVRPAYRGRGIAASLLDAALRHYSALGFARCSVDFESFNPDAANFWPRYFQPVCFSLMRVPELGPGR